MLYLTCDDKGRIVDICSDKINVSVKGKIAEAPDLAATGGKPAAGEFVRYEVADASGVLVGDHFDGKALTADSPQRAVIAAEAAALASDVELLERVAAGGAKPEDQTKAIEIMAARVKALLGA